MNQICSAVNKCRQFYTMQLGLPIWQPVSAILPAAQDAAVSAVAPIEKLQKFLEITRKEVLGSP